MKHLVFAFIFLISQSLRAEDLKFDFKNYDEAQKAQDFVRFDMKSTKLGLLTTSFTGFVKSFTAKGDLKSTGIENASVEWTAESMDTDIDGRNEKMWELCLDYKNHPTLKLIFDEPISFGENEIKAHINVRGVDKPVTVAVKALKTDAGVFAEGKAKLSIRALELPDPSIAIASVKDEIVVSFKIHK